jgi:regulator of protease activity HflC (stomatin/prohibitin superfamily)
MLGRSGVNGLLMTLTALVAGALVVLAYRRVRKIETVYPWEAALLYVNGGFVRQLPAGRHTFLTLGRTIAVQRAPLWNMPVPITPAEVVTADRFAARVAATATFRINDPRKAIEGQMQYLPRLSLAVAEALAAEVAKRSLESLLTERMDLGPQVVEAVARQFDEISVTALFVTNIQLPPETRRLSTEVERARLEGLAALERARGEQAALRVLANAARLVKDNPDLLRLRALQAVGQAGKGATLVLGQDLVAPIAPPKAD